MSVMSNYNPLRNKQYAPTLAEPLAPYDRNDSANAKYRSDIDPAYVVENDAPAVDNSIDLADFNWGSADDWEQYEAQFEPSPVGVTQEDIDAYLQATEAEQIAAIQTETAFEGLTAQLKDDPKMRDRVSNLMGTPLSPDLTAKDVEALASFMKMLGQREEDRLEAEVAKLRLRDAAHKAYNAEKAGDIEELPLLGLQDLLDADTAPNRFIIDGLLHHGGNVMFTAARKSGKSTTAANLIRSLVDGVPFLGVFDVTTTRKVALLDFELSEATLQAWLNDQGIVNRQNVTVIPLRGRGRAFNILNDDVRDRIAKQLTGVDVLILDPLRPLSDALGLNEHTEMGKLLEAFDALKHEAGISEGIIIHHHGHGQDRARGDSRLEDWPDAVWRLNRKDIEDTRGFRLFSAFGRDVDVQPGILQMDPITRHLEFLGDVKHAQQTHWVDAIVAVLEEHGELATEPLANLVHGLDKNNRASVFAEAVATGRVNKRKQGTSTLYAVAEKPF